jgi:hypothetical protein
MPTFSLVEIIGISDYSLVDIQILIDKAGGVAHLGSRVGVARTTVLDWKRTGFVPGNRVRQISAALKIFTKEVLKLVRPPKVRGMAAVPKPKRSARTPAPKQPKAAPKRQTKPPDPPADSRQEQSA